MKHPSVAFLEKSKSSICILTGFQSWECRKKPVRPLGLCSLPPRAEGAGKRAELDLVPGYNYTVPMNLPPILAVLLHTGKQNKQKTSKRIILVAGNTCTSVVCYLLLLAEDC